jgi:uncharacterized glyoxalase superfamily protein PhnB
MARKYKPVPEEFHTITPHITVRGAAAAIDFYKRAFGAEELLRNFGPDGESVMHCEMLLGDSRFFINEEYPEHGVRSPAALNGSPITLHLYVADVDAMYERAVRAGAEVLMPVEDQFWGDRYCIVRDPFGHRWSIASRLEDLSPRELRERADDYFSKPGALGKEGESEHAM